MPAHAGIDAAPKYGTGHEHYDTADNFGGSTELLSPNEQEWSTFRRQAGAENDMTLCGVEALPKYGMGHEHKDTEDQFGALMLVPTTGVDLRTGADVVPRYGGGVELMDGHLIKAEDKDTFAHLEYGTLHVKEEYDTSFDINAFDTGQTVAPGLGYDFAPTYAASQKGFLTTNKPTARTKPRAKSLAQAKATIYGRAYQRAPTYTSPKTSNAKAEKCISKAKAQHEHTERLKAKAKDKASQFDFRRHMAAKHSHAKPRAGPGHAQPGSSRTGSVGLPGVKANRSARHVRSGGGSAAAPSSGAGAGVGGRAGRASAAQAEVRRRDEMRLKQLRGTEMQYGQQHVGKDTQSSLEARQAGFVPAEETSQQGFGPGVAYKRGHEHKDTQSSLGAKDDHVVPDHTSSSRPGFFPAPGGSYGAGHEDMDTIDNYDKAAGFLVPNVDTTGRDGHVRVWENGVKYGAGHEDLDTKDNFDKNAGFLVPNVGTDSSAEMRQGQGYTEEHLNKDTFSHFTTGPSMLLAVKVRGDFAPGANTYEDMYGVVHTRGKTSTKRYKPPPRKVAFPGHVLGLDRSPELRPNRWIGRDAEKQDPRYVRYTMHASGNLISAARPNSAQLKFPGYSVVGAKYNVEGKISGTDTYKYTPNTREGGANITTKITRDRDLSAIPKYGSGKVTEKICSEQSRVLARY